MALRFNMRIDEDKKAGRATFTDAVPDLSDPKKPGKFYKYTAKEKLFVYHYLTDANFVAVTAVKKAKYGTARTAEGTFRAIASHIMKKPRIMAAINQAFETLVMPKFEQLFRIGRIAAGNIDDLLDDAGNLSIDAARERGSMHLLKKVQITRSVREVKRTEVDTPDDAAAEFVETSIIDETIKFEIHDPLRALEMLGRNSHLFPAGSAVEIKTRAAGQTTDEPAQVVIYIPDNGRGDAMPGPGTTNEAAKASTPAKSRTRR